MERRTNAKIDAKLEQNLEKVPKAIYYIIPNELCERYVLVFSFFHVLIPRMCYFGINPLLNKYFKDFLQLDQVLAKEYTHLITTLAYFFPLLGGALSDSYFGKFLVITAFSVIYVFGVGILSVMSIPGITGTPPTLWGAMLGLVLIGMGTGGIKPCVSAVCIFSRFEFRKLMLSMAVINTSHLNTEVY